MVLGAEVLDPRGSGVPGGEPRSGGITDPPPDRTGQSCTATAPSDARWQETVSPREIK